jgi:hypothetical protein
MGLNPLSTLIIIIAAILIGVQSNNIRELDFNCEPCVLHGGYYCYDDPWKVNFNGDKCYEYAVDRVACKGFGFTNNITNCTGTKLWPSEACNLTAEYFMEWAVPMTYKMTLEPRSACYFSIFAFIGDIKMKHAYPSMLFHSLDDGNHNLTHFNQT